MSHDNEDLKKLTTIDGKPLSEEAIKELREIAGQIDWKEFTPRPDRDPKYYFIPKESYKRKPHRKHGSNYTPPKRRHRK